MAMATRAGASTIRAADAEGHVDHALQQPPAARRGERRRGGPAACPAAAPGRPARCGVEAVHQQADGVGAGRELGDQLGDARGGAGRHGDDDAVDIGQQAVGLHVGGAAQHRHAEDVLGRALAAVVEDAQDVDVAAGQREGDQPLGGGRGAARSSGWASAGPGGAGGGCSRTRPGARAPSTGTAVEAPVDEVQDVGRLGRRRGSRRRR